MNLHSRMKPDTVSLTRDLTAHPDPLALYAALSNNGSREDTLLFAQLDGPTFILDRAAVRIECRGSDVVVTALSANGRNLVETIGARMEERVIESEAGLVRLRFPEVESDDAEERLRSPSPFDVLEALTIGLSQVSDDDPFAVLCLGIIAYDHVDVFETLPPAAEDPLGFPDFLFWVAESLIVFEHGRKPRAICTAFHGERTSKTHEEERLSELVERCERTALPAAASVNAGLPQAVEIQVDLDDHAFADLVARLKEHIAAGDVYQIVASRTFSAPCANPFEAFRALSHLDPSPYGFFVSARAYQLFGASPETSLRLFHREGAPHVELKPIAGTRPRGQSADEDDRLEAELRLDSKEVSEHMMLVDLARNDVARISVPGSRRITQMMGVERYARVMHLVSTVRGKLKADCDVFHALKACLNMGTLTGAPKIRAMELLRHAEQTKRGPYGGTIGWISGDGTMDSAIVIRSAFVKDGCAFVRAGAGIVHDSDPDSEADETKRKAGALLSVLAGSAA